MIAQIGAACVFLVAGPAPAPAGRRSGAPIGRDGAADDGREASAAAGGIDAGGVRRARRWWRPGSTTPTLAAHQIVMSVFLFLALSLDALAVPAQTIVAEQLGRDDRLGGGRDRAPGDAPVVDRGVGLCVLLAAVGAVCCRTCSPMTRR